ncbi:hypothetical protein HY628_00720 [Candidatus Uhrbacteria bacterium]|nr:hypothetical protein [Candidatus Uhrbacteria bacterium]
MPPEEEIIAFEAEPASDEERQTEYLESYPNARHCGFYWDTPAFRHILFFEAACRRLFRTLVAQGQIRRDEISPLIDRVRNGYSHGKPIPSFRENKPVAKIVSFLRSWQKWGKTGLAPDAEEVLVRLKQRSRRNRAF